MQQNLLNFVKNSGKNSKNYKKKTFFLTCGVGNPIIKLLWKYICWIISDAVHRKKYHIIQDRFHINVLHNTEAY